MKVLIVFAAFIAVCSARGAFLNKGECFTRNDPMKADRNCFRMVIQNDGDMVIYRESDNSRVWSSDTVGRGGYKACMQRKF
jgi:hypothetical protein